VSGTGVLNTRSSDEVCAARVHFPKTYYVNLYDEKQFPGIKEHVLFMQSVFGGTCRCEQLTVQLNEKR
jgi:hypothetical protein